MQLESNLSRSCSKILALILLIPLHVFASPTAETQSATTETGDEIIEQLQLQIAEIRREAQRKLEALQLETEQQLSGLQARMEQLSNGADTTAKNHDRHSTDPGKNISGSPLDKLDVSGDFRLRYEANYSDDNMPFWDRGVLRGRLAARYALSDTINLGARMATGDPDNPRTSDVTIGDFAADLDVSLDQAYLAFSDRNLFLTGGKFAKPFTSTELVWDGDVNPQGAGGSYNVFESSAWSPKLTAIYFIINQSIYEQGSDMLGGQFSLGFKLGKDWDMTLHTAYYDYDIGARKIDVPGGARGNNVTPDGRYYLSDFNLFDTIGTLEYSGFDDRWNVRLVADYVKNLGATVPEDTGYGFDLLVGNLEQPGHLLFHYGYSRAETDAVLGTFSNDNILYPTNYELHTFAVDYALRAHTFLGLTNYVYRRLEATPQSPELANDWISRTRLNLYFTF